MINDAEEGVVYCLRRGGPSEGPKSTTVYEELVKYVGKGIEPGVHIVKDVNGTAKTCTLRQLYYITAEAAKTLLCMGGGTYEPPYQKNSTNCKNCGFSRRFHDLPIVGYSRIHYGGYNYYLICDKCGVAGHVGELDPKKIKHISPCVPETTGGQEAPVETSTPAPFLALADKISNMLTQTIGKIDLPSWDAECLFVIATLDKMGKVDQPDQSKLRDWEDRPSEEEVDQPELRDWKWVAHHNDGCTDKLNNGYCPECELYPDMQSMSLKPYCPDHNVRLQNNVCPECNTTFKRPNRG